MGLGLKRGQALLSEESLFEAPLFLLFLLSGFPLLRLGLSLEDSPLELPGRPDEPGGSLADFHFLGRPGQGEFSLFDELDELLSLLNNELVTL